MIRDIKGKLVVKDLKEIKELKAIKDLLAIRGIKGSKAIKERKAIRVFKVLLATKATKATKVPKALKAPKALKEPKAIRELRGCKEIREFKVVYLLPIQLQLAQLWEICGMILLQELLQFIMIVFGLRLDQALKDHRVQRDLVRLQIMIKLYYLSKFLVRRNYGNIFKTHSLGIN